MTLSVMERVVRETSESLDKSQVVDIIKQASSELTASKASHVVIKLLF